MAMAPTAMDCFRSSSMLLQLLLVVLLAATQHVFAQGVRLGRDGIVDGEGFRAQEKASWSWFDQKLSKLYVKSLLEVLLSNSPSNDATIPSSTLASSPSPSMESSSLPAPSLPPTPSRSSESSPLLAPSPLFSPLSSPSPPPKWKYHHRFAPRSPPGALPRKSHNLAPSPSVILPEGPPSPASKQKLRKPPGVVASSPTPSPTVAVSHGRHPISLSPSPFLTPQIAPTSSTSPSPARVGAHSAPSSPATVIAPPAPPSTATTITPSAPPPSPATAIAPSSPTNDGGCNSLVCTPPLAKSSFMAPCGCVQAIQVQIELTMPLYSLFPLVSLLATDVAEALVLSTRQVEIVGATTDSRETENSIVDMNLVPLGQEFDNITAFLIYQKLWQHELVLNATLFGNYSVIHVLYPGLPASPPIISSNGIVPVAAQNPFGAKIKKKSFNLAIGTFAVIALCSAVSIVLCLGAFWIGMLKLCYAETKNARVEPGIVSGWTKRSGLSAPSAPSGPSEPSALSSDIESSAVSISYASSMATYTSTAKTFTFAELDRATERFNLDNVIGEGGFGRVYSGILDDGRKVAVKVLTRDDHQGGREFIAEVETLSRLHHRNLVELIGICIEDHNRCLVYELIPNGSVESHLHGVDKVSCPLDWDARMKIALGAARGLAYLHEDSNPRVIHRDFKASNILLENDFNPKVADFGLAKAAPDEGSGHLSTRVMGTFGYVAPEYAMTGHLLVKSDVYSYGVVLLELLSGRKPVDMSQPQGQENLVTWARPLLASEEGISILVDPALHNAYPPNNLARVAAIASMCVQPEVSHRPFMGEVVQALKLVYSDASSSSAANVGGGGGVDDMICSSAGAGSLGGAGGESCDFSEALVGGSGREPWIAEERNSSYALDSFISIDYDSGASHGATITTNLGRPCASFASSSSSCGADHVCNHQVRACEGSLRRHSLSGPPFPGRMMGLNKYSQEDDGGVNTELVECSRFCVTE